MEIIEIVVYMAVAVILGGIILVLLATTSSEPVTNLLEQSMNNQQSISFSQVNIINFYGLLIDKANSCLSTNIDNQTLFVEEEGIINKTTFFNIIQQTSLCSTIQSQEMDCGEREDVEHFSITTPSIVTIICEEQVLKIE